MMHPETWVVLEVDDSVDPPMETLYSPYTGQPLPKTDEFPIPWGPELWPWVSISEETFRNVPAMFRQRRVDAAKGARGPGESPPPSS
jgi:hypothetical protein